MDQASRPSKTDPYRTLEVVRSAEARRLPKRHDRRRRTAPALGYAVAASAGALLVAFGALIGNRLERVVPGHASLASRPISVSATLAMPANPPAPPPADPQPPPSGRVRIAAAVEVVSPDPAPPAVARPKRARRVSRPAEAPREVPEPAEEADESALLARQCARVDGTVFRPPVSQAELMNVRSDGELMRVIVSVDTVAEGYPAFISVLFENGGDSSVLLDRLESSSADGALRPVSAATLPARVPAGGLREIYRYPLTPSRGESHSRRFVVEDEKGDSWGTTVHRVACDN